MMLFAYLLGAFAFIGGIGLTISSGWLITMASMHPPILTLSVAIVLVRFFGIFRSVARYSERLISHKAVFGRLTALRVRIYQSLVSSSIAVARTFNSGTSVKTIVDDVERAQEYELRVKLPSSSAIISLFAGVALGFWIRPQTLFLSIPASALLLFIYPALIARKSQVIARSIEKSENAYTQILEGSIHGVTEALIYGYLADNLAQARAAEDSIRHQEEDLLKVTWRFSSLANFTIALSVVGFSWLALVLNNHHPIPAVQTTMLIFLPLVIFEAITAWYPNLFAAGKMLMSAQSVRELIKIEADAGSQNVFDEEITRICADNVSVWWDQPFMKPTSFELHTGELLVIRGASGSGKSTLAMGLLGLLPYEGSLTINYQERSSFSDVSGRIVGTVQRSHIFNTTVRENLRIANQDATDAQILHVLHLVELDQLLSELDNGLDTLIGDFGRIISGGEAKRLAIARVLLAEAEIYILDEPTEHLDFELAMRLERVITTHLAKKIAIVITHSGWEKANKTLTMER